VYFLKSAELRGIPLNHWCFTPVNACCDVRDQLNPTASNEIDSREDVRFDVEPSRCDTSLMDNNISGFDYINEFVSTTEEQKHVRSVNS